MRRFTMGVLGLVAGTTVLVGLKTPGLARTAGPPAPAALDTTGDPAGRTTAPVTRTFTGRPVAAMWQGTDYGPMRVQVVVTGRHLDDIITLAQSDQPKTVATTLRRQALTSQNPNVGTVSGATASSDAFRASLLSALAQAGQ